MRRIFLILVLLLVVHYVPPYPSKPTEETGFRKVVVLNPLPFEYNGLIYFDVKFSYGEAYNGTLSVKYEEGQETNYYIFDEKFYGNSCFYSTVRLAVYVRVPPFSYRNLLVEFYSNEMVGKHVGNFIVRRENATGDIVVYTSSVNARFNISVYGGLYRLILKNVSDESISIYGFNFPGFSIFLSNGSIVTSSDLDIQGIYVDVNSSLVSVIRIVQEGYGINYTRIYYFSSFTPLVYMELTLEINRSYDIKAIYPIILDLNGEIFDKINARNNVTVNLSEDRIVKSIYPAPSWLYLNSGEKRGLAILINDTMLNLPLILNKTIVNYLNQTATNETIAFYSNIVRNFTSILYASKSISEGLNITYLIDSLAYLQNLSDALELLIENSTDGLFNLSSSLRRLVVLKEGDTLSLAYQLEPDIVKNDTLSLKYGVCLASIYSDSVDRLRKMMLEMLLKMHLQLSPVIYPFRMGLSSPSEVEVDELFNVTVLVDVMENVRNLTLAVNVDEGLKIIGNNSLCFLNLSSGSSISANFTVLPLVEGIHEIEVSMLSEYGYTTLEKIVNVSIIPFIPKRKEPRFNLTIRCSDYLGKPLPSCIVLLYSNTSGEVVAKGVTNSSGIIEFRNLTSDNYIVLAKYNELCMNRSLYLAGNVDFNFNFSLADMTIQLIDSYGKPIKGLYVSLLDSEGNLLFMDISDDNGMVFKSRLPIGRYTVIIKWGDVNLNYYMINLTGEVVKLRVDVYNVTIYVYAENTPLAYALVRVTAVEGKAPPGWRTQEVKAYTDSLGRVSLILPKGMFRISVSKGQYFIEKVVDVDRNLVLTLSVKPTSYLWILAAVVIVMWSGIGFWWYRTESVVYREKMRYKQLLERLEDLYRKGLVEEKYYVKLKKEYEEKLRKL